VLIQAHKSDPDMVAKLDARRQAISDAKRKLWGLDAPTKADVTSGGAALKGYVTISPADWQDDDAA
jgi:hypothetical protein